MKFLLLTSIAALGLSTPMIFAQEEPLTNRPTQDGQNVQVGQLACPLTVQGLTVRDSAGNPIPIPLLTDPASVSSTTQIGDTLYALIPPDANSKATALILYQTGSLTSDDLNKAVQDALNHNNWFDATYDSPRPISDTDQPLPAGTQFWVCSSTGFVTLADSNGTISLAGPPAPPVDSSDPGITGLLLLTGTSTTTTPTTTP